MERSLTRKSYLTLLTSCLWFLNCLVIKTRLKTETLFRQQCWSTLQLAPDQVTSSESVYRTTLAYSYQCQPLSECVGCWSHCQPASVRDSVCLQERLAISTWRKSWKQTTAHACAHVRTSDLQNKTVKGMPPVGGSRLTNCIHGPRADNRSLVHMHACVHVRIHTCIVCMCMHQLMSNN